MAQVIELPEILKALESIDLIAAMESAFVAYSEGRAVVPPVGELLFDDPPGDAHIKYGYLKQDDVFVVKVATGFYENPKRGLPATSGLILVFGQRDGMVRHVLLDEGHLTNVRTAAAGAVAAKHLARRDAAVIGVMGTGQQARLQLDALRPVTAARDVRLWGRDPAAAAACAADLVKLGFAVRIEAAASKVAIASDILVTTTAATLPVVENGDIRPGTHITAMGSDTEDKQELSAALVARADVLVADSRSQCLVRGEIHHAVTQAQLDPLTIRELGDVIAMKVPGRETAEQVTIADLTGVAVQDIAIAKAVIAAIGGR